HPWQAPAGVSQTNLTSMAEIEGDTQQSVVRVPGLGNLQSMWDMVSFDPTGRYIFIPHETPMGAGVTRYDTSTDKAEVLFAGDSKGVRGETADWTNDWGAFDPSTFTPNGTVLLGEEWSGLGRIIEIINPLADARDIVIRELESIPNVSHEGLRFSPDGQALYFVDEWNSGSLYKIVFQNTEDYTAGGQVFVLSVNDFNGDASKNWNNEANTNAPRTGTATWVPLTDAQGNASTQINPFKNGISSDCSNPDTFGGRCAADEAGGTPYGRPEDMEVGTLPNGTVIIYFAATSERTVYSVKEMAKNTADVQVFASDADTPKNLGYPATTGEMNSPDNLAQDALGNIYIIEDAPNGSDVGGDIWFGRDTNSDGIAESIDHFMSIVADGAEATGMIFNPANPSQFIVAVQHPDSTNIDDYPEGFGDALWLFDLTNVVPPPCSNGQGTVRTCTVEQSGSEVNFISSLENTGNPTDNTESNRGNVQIWW
ncbi:MAG: DUF839 domain-containing protein, partial [Gammaproteobacteria bacterium]|nr:DUF839 domain-containing protein [Gammaproteobacteria bacterium]